MKQQGIAPIIIVLALLAVGILSALAVVYSRPNNTAVHPTTVEPTPSATSGKHVTVRGKVVCLSSKNTGGIQPMSCAMGLQTSDGTYWALNNIQNYLMKGTFAGGDTIEVEGTNASYTGPLQAAGTIDVTSVRVLQKSAQNGSE